MARERKGHNNRKAQSCAHIQSYGRTYSSLAPGRGTVMLTTTISPLHHHLVAGVPGAESGLPARHQVVVGHAPDSQAGGEGPRLHPHLNMRL